MYVWTVLLQSSQPVHDGQSGGMPHRVGRPPSGWLHAGGLGALPAERTQEAAWPGVADESRMLICLPQLRSRMPSKCGMPS